MKLRQMECDDLRKNVFGDNAIAIFFFFLLLFFSFLLGAGNGNDWVANFVWSSLCGRYFVVVFGRNRKTWRLV